MGSYRERKQIMERKFKVGDLVKTKSDLICGKWYGAVSFDPFMVVTKGVKIKTVPSGDIDTFDSAYKLDNGYYYDEDMLELVSTIQTDPESIQSKEIDASVLSTPDSIRHFSTGAVRDSGEGKPRMGLLPWDLLKRVAMHYTKGAERYGEDNWRKGQPKKDTFDSLDRHLTAYRAGETDEDHLSAVIWNAFSMMHVDEYLLREHPELDFSYKYPKK